MMEQHVNYETELAGKVALITGGTKGAGKAIADRLVQAGATVLVTARNKPENSSSGVHFIGADLSTPDGTEAVIREVKRSQPRKL